MNKIIRRVKDQFDKTSDQLKLDKVIISILLIFFIFIFGSNTFKTITNNLFNYETFLKEQESLERLRKRNSELTQELEYVSSDEFKKILLRDTLGVADDSERLYRTKQNAQYYEEQITLLDLREKVSYWDWWELLIR